MTRLKKYKYGMILAALVFVAHASYAQQQSQGLVPASVLVARNDSLANLNKPVQQAAMYKGNLGADTTGQVSNQPPKMRLKRPANWPPVDNETTPPPVIPAKKPGEGK